MSLTSTGVFDLAGHTETITNFVLSDSASVTTGTGRLVIGNRIGTGGGSFGSVSTVTGNIDLGGGNRTIDAFGSSLVIDGVISNGSANLSAFDTHTLRLRGAANTYTGLTTVNATNLARIHFEKSAVDGAVRGDLTIRGDGFLILGASEQILAASGNEVFVDRGRLDLQTFSETIQDLILKVGHVTGSGTLSVLGTLKTLPSGFHSAICANINLQGSRVFDIASGGNLDVGGVVSNGAVVKNGPGVLRFNRIIPMQAAHF